MMLVLPSCEKWFKQPNYIEYTKHLQQVLSKDSPCVKALAIDLGLDSKLVAEKINAVFQSFPFISVKKTSQKPLRWGFLRTTGLLVLYMKQNYTISLLINLMS